MDSTVKRGDIYYADLSPVIGSEQGGIRPVLNYQNNTANLYSTTITMLPITSKLKKLNLPERMSPNAMLQVLNLLYSLEELQEIMESI
mgnify:CR=1 FL=1